MGEIYIDGEPMEPMPPAKPWPQSPAILPPTIYYWPTPSLRQFYAGLAMQGMLAGQKSGLSGSLKLSADAFAAADAMIAYEKEHPGSE